MIFLIIAISYLTFIATWIFYLAVMVLRRHKDELTGVARFFGWQVLFVGALLDAFLNVVIATMFFLEPPREWLLTDRLKRHISADTWRGKLSRWVCFHLLDKFDPSGRHC